MGRTSGKSANPSAMTMKAMPKKVATIGDMHKTIQQAASAAEAESAQVDSKFPNRELYEIAFLDGKPMSTYMNQADLRNNHNKFYIIQVVQKKGQVGMNHVAHIYTRYGRVGVDGVTSNSLTTWEDALKTFNKTCRTKQRKGYTEIKVAGSGSAAKDVSTKATVQFSTTGKGVPKSSLAPGLEKLVEFFFNKKLMEESVVSVNVDVRKMPLGELSKQTVLQGYSVLRQLEQAIKNNNQSQLLDLTSRFYTIIPHNFGMKKMSLFVIKTQEQVKEKYDLITNLLDIQVANNILESSATVQKLEQNPADANYAQLKCNIKQLDKSNANYKLIERYLHATQEHLRLNIVDCFAVERDGEINVFNPNNLGGKKLLWHGSRFSNFVGILSQGMRIAPPEAPIAGHNFGKGVYFADLIGKSYHYSAPYISNGIGTFVLCEVALGTPRPMLQPDPSNAANLPAGSHSTHAVGTRRPKPSGSEWFEGDIEVPLGQVEDYHAGYMGANEWVVYNTNQIRMRFIVRCRAS